MKQNNSGFTLLEVIIALGILAIAMAAAIKGVSDYANNATYLRNRTFAHWVAMNQIAEYQLGKEWPAIGKRDGSAIQGKFEWRWRGIVSQTADKDLRRVDVEVRMKKDDADPLAIASAFIGRPTTQLNANPE